MSQSYWNWAWLKQSILMGPISKPTTHVPMLISILMLMASTLSLTQTAAGLGSPGIENLHQKMAKR